MAAIFNIYKSTKKVIQIDKLISSFDKVFRALKDESHINNI
jgi:hypothetical protein